MSHFITVKVSAITDVKGAFSKASLITTSKAKGGKITFLSPPKTTVKGKFQIISVRLFRPITYINQTITLLTNETIDFGPLEFAGITNQLLVSGQTIPIQPEIEVIFEIKVEI
jgi:hypothetical protein